MREPLDLRLGLANRVVPRDTLLTAAKTLAYTLAQYDLRVLTLAKRAIRQGADLPLAEGLQLEKRLFAMLI